MHCKPNKYILTSYYPFGMPMPGRNANPGGYKYGFNGMEKDDELKGSGNSFDFGARIFDPRIGRWLSLDPLANKYPSNSPFSFVANSPIAFVDPNGKENIIYLVILPGAAAKLTVTQKAEIIRKANEILQSKLGVNTKVVLYESSDPFDPQYLDNTDSYVVLGKKDELNTANNSEPFFRPGNGDAKLLNSTTSENLSKYNPENADRANGSLDKPRLDPGGIIQLEAIVGTSELFGEDLEDMIGFTVVHAAIHNAYPGSHVSGTVLAEGDEINNAIQKGKNLSDFEKDNNNKALKKAMEATYGTKKPEENYESNKKN